MIKDIRELFRKKKEVKYIVEKKPSAKITFQAYSEHDILFYHDINGHRIETEIKSIDDFVEFWKLYWYPMEDRKKGVKKHNE